MDKEKEIDKMVEIARKNGEKIHAETDGWADIYDDMTALYEANYRQADEVRKETAREFKQTMKDIFRFVLRNKGNTSIPYFNAEELVFAKFDKEVDREFLQKYGVEVVE